MSDVIYNETGIGDLKGKTPNYNFNIPYFDIATWHDYIEENFRSIDALFHYIYEIKHYKGKWENNTTYNIDDVLFIADNNSEFVGRLVKVLLEHTTSDKPFDEFYSENSTNYEILADPNYAYLYAKEAEVARDEAINAKNELTNELFTNYCTKTELNNVKLEFNNKLGQIDDVLDIINGEII
jgi:hypothetical protein